MITGGSKTLKKAFNYKFDGSNIEQALMEELPDLNNERFHHGCSSYLGNDNEKVNVGISKCFFTKLAPCSQTFCQGSAGCGRF